MKKKKRTLLGFRKKKESGDKPSAVKIQEERTHLLSHGSDFFMREAYKTLRTNVTFSLTGENSCSVIAVTSSYQSEGKSITASNLAISYAQADNRVLLIDCDLRRPKLGRLHNISGSVGLSNVLIKPNLLEQAIHHTDTPGLDIIAAGDIPPNPSELLGSQRMQKLLLEMKVRYDYIVLDTTPVNMVTDAVVLSAYCDGVVFVARANHVERGSVLHAVGQLEYANAKILGFVLNGVDLEQTTYGYGKYRYRRYGRYGRYGYSRYGYGRYGYSSRYGYGYGYARSPYEAQEAEAKKPPSEE